MYYYYAQKPLLEKMCRLLSQSLRNIPIPTKRTRRLGNPHQSTIQAIIESLYSPPSLIERSPGHTATANISILTVAGMHLLIRCPTEFQVAG